MDKKRKIYWWLNLALAGVVFIVLLALFLYRYFAVGTPVEATWGEEIGKYLIMWPALWGVCAVICYVPFKALSAYITKLPED